ncbi:MAG: hypothetical protein JSV00_03555, partial [bacterium]
RVLKKSLVDFFSVGLLGAARRNPRKSFVFLQLGFGRRPRVALSGCVIRGFQQPARRRGVPVQPTLTARLYPNGRKVQGDVLKRLPRGVVPRHAMVIFLTVDINNFPERWSHGQQKAFHPDHG